MITQTKKKLSGGQLVGKSHVEELIRNYKQHRWIHNTNRLGKEDSLSSWYDLNSLSQFLEKAREAGADGIKMYFGVYPDNFELMPDYSNRQTIVMVATKAKTNASGSIVNKEIYFQQSGKTEILAFNLSYICPPDCSSGLPGEDGLDSIGISIFTNKDQMIVV